MRIGLRRRLKYMLRGGEWPVPSYRLNYEPRILFIVTPPGSGSTPLATLLRTAPGTAFLNRRGEGQWIVPGLRATDPWNPEMRVNWESVRAVWMHRVQILRDMVDRVDLIIEKSPPNMVRLDRMLEVFPNHSVVVLNRNPYANVASILHRNFPIERMTATERERRVSELAEAWISRSRWLKRWKDDPDLNAVSISYEEFCADPGGCLERLAAVEPVLVGADAAASVSVKDHPAQPIVDMNRRQILQLTEAELTVVGRLLAPEAELLAEFGYTP